MVTRPQDGQQPACCWCPSKGTPAGTVSASPLFLLVGAEDRHGWVGCVHQPPRPHAHRVGANSLVTRLPDEHSLYAVWCHLNAPPAAVAPRGPVCPCLASTSRFKVQELESALGMVSEVHRFKSRRGHLAWFRRERLPWPEKRRGPGFRGSRFRVGEV